MKILFTYKEPLATFIKTEMQCLGEVIPFAFPNIKKVSQLTAFIEQLIFLLQNRTDIYYCFFADYHCFLPALFSRLTGKRLFIVVIGFDAFRAPEIKYGLWQSSLIRRLLVKFALKRATVTSYSKLLSQHLELNCGVKSIVIHPALQQIDTYTRKKEAISVTVASCSTYGNFLRKGLDEYIEIARKDRTKRKYIIIGNSYIPNDLPDNIDIYSNLSNGEVLRYLENADKYYQCSRYEGSGVAIIEAITKGCEVILTHPDMVGGAEYLHKEPDYFFWGRRRDELFKLIT